MAKREGKGDCEKWKQWNLSYGGFKEPSQHREWNAGIICSSGKVQWYMTSAGDSDQAMVTGEGPERSALSPPWQQLVHKPGLAFGTSGRSCLADYFINWAASAQGEIQSEKTKQEQQNNLKKKKKLMILCRMIHVSGSYPHHHHIWGPHNPTIPRYWIAHATLATL